MPTSFRHAERSTRRKALRFRSAFQNSPKDALEDGRLDLQWNLLMLFDSNDLNKAMQRYFHILNGKLSWFVAQAMSDKEKSRFDDMAKQDKVRYDQEMMHYMPGKRGKKKDPNAPKRPPWVDIPHAELPHYLENCLYAFIMKGILLIWCCIRQIGFQLLSCQIYSNILVF